MTDMGRPFGQYGGGTRACPEHALVTLVLGRWGFWIGQPVCFFSNARGGGRETLPNNGGRVLQPIISLMRIRY